MSVSTTACVQERRPFQDLLAQLNEQHESELRALQLEVRISWLWVSQSACCTAAGGGEQLSRCAMLSLPH